MRVKAKFTNNNFGFYAGIRRYDGDEFILADKKDFSKSWMEPVKEKRTRKPKDVVIEQTPDEPEKVEEGAE